MHATTAEEYKLAAHAMLHLKVFHTHIKRLASLQQQQISLNDHAIAGDATCGQPENIIAISVDIMKIESDIRGNLSELPFLQDLDNGLASLLIDNPLLSDCFLIVNKTKTYYAHKSYLMKASSYFEAMFKSHFEESGLSNVPIHFDNPEMFEEVLEFIYTGKIGKGHVESDRWVSGADTYFYALWMAIYLHVNELITKLVQWFDNSFCISAKFCATFIPLDVLIRILDVKLNTLRSRDKIIGAQPPITECRNFMPCNIFSAATTTNDTNSTTTNAKNRQQMNNSALTLCQSSPQFEHESLFEICICYAGHCNDPEINSNIINWLNTSNITRSVNLDRAIDLIMDSPLSLQTAIDPLGILQQYHQNKIGANRIQS